MSFFSLKGRPTVKTEYKGIPECTIPGLHAAIFERFAKMIPVGSAVIDLASGVGAWAQRMADHRYEVVACDLHPEISKFPSKKIDLNEAFSKHFSPDHFAAVTAIEMLEHMENPRHVLREANQILRHGGYLFLSTPNASGLHSRLKFFFTGHFAMFDDEQYHSIGHIRPLTYWELDKILGETGFSVKQVFFHNNYDAIPRTVGEVVKLAASIFLRPFVRGVAGGQVIVIIAEKTKSLVPSKAANLAGR
jgi:SAM-dependent methyltransferase